MELTVHLNENNAWTYSMKHRYQIYENLLIGLNHQYVVTARFKQKISLSKLNLWC